MTSELLSVTSFTVAMAALATLLMLPPGVAVAWLLARRRFPGRSMLETLVSLPLVLPPVATGLILLWCSGAAVRSDGCWRRPDWRCCSRGGRWSWPWR